MKAADEDFPSAFVSFYSLRSLRSLRFIFFNRQVRGGR